MNAKIVNYVYDITWINEKYVERQKKNLAWFYSINIMYCRQLV